MTKFLFAILIMITGLRLIADCGNLAYKFPITQPAAQEEESKSEHDDTKNGKRYNEDIYHTSVVQYSLFIVTAILSSSGDQKPYDSFTDKPNTPPPDFT